MYHLIGNILYNIQLLFCEYKLEMFLKIPLDDIKLMKFIIAVLLFRNIYQPMLC